MTNEYYCQACDRDLEKYGRYRTHMLLDHGVKV